MQSAIATVDIGDFFGPASPGRDAADRALMEAAAGTGFLVATGIPDDLAVDANRRRALLRVFDLPPDEIRALWRRKFDPSHANLYRGWFPVQPGHLTAKEGIDLGGDVAHGPGLIVGDDPLREATPLPAEPSLPGWRAAVAAYYRDMERISAALMRAIARGLGLEEHHFDAAFTQGLSTLRLIRYPRRSAAELAAAADAGVWVRHASERRQLTGAPHVDSGFLTLLAQDGVPGLQARHVLGDWIDVPPLEGALVVNFGKVLERWCAGRIRATEHRVLGGDRERRSIPFFYEARAEAEIAPLPFADAATFEPFLYGDYLWATTTQFVEFHGMAALRPPRRVTASLSRPSEPSSRPPV
jgi:isopenicillin N synthase-like dioxygenase